jgi:hypothetical protein
MSPTSQARSWSPELFAAAAITVVDWADDGWRGGNLNVELGLFAVKSGNLLTPIVDFLSEISNAAGISFIGQAKPFLPLISKGMDLIAGQT